MIKLENVNKYFNKHKKNEIHVINNTSLNFPKTGLIAILGPSGCGKTTLLNTIGGLDNVSSGHIYVDGERITKVFSHKIDEIRNLKIGYIFQDYKLVDNMSVFDNVALSLKLIGLKDKKKIEERVMYTLEKVNMARYKNRPASMLSGGERQRVGIARALVKNPKIIIADEPTGNLDSKNSLEVMNIIKGISEKYLVILVTHEEELARFYASRIVELKDGVVTNDYENKHDNSLNYEIENQIYLKEFKDIKKIKKDNLNIDVYRDNAEDLDIKVVFKNGNIYIATSDDKKIEVVESNSNIELIDDYKKEKKIDNINTDFDMSSLEDANFHPKYSSIFKLGSFISYGFKKILDYPILKKILLFGFILTGMFIFYATSSICATLKIDDADFITMNKNYLTISNTKISVNDYLNYEKNQDTLYLLPSDSLVNFKIFFDKYLQTSDTNYVFSGSLVSSDELTSEALLMGRGVQDDYEIVVDKMVLESVSDSNNAKMAGFTNLEDFLNHEVYLDNLKPFKIVGISDTSEPSIYAKNNMFINIIANSSNQNEDYYMEDNMANKLLDYDLFKDNISITKGSIPNNDYEVLVPFYNELDMPINKTIDTKVNGKKLKVVGYYEVKNDDSITGYFVNNNTIKYDLISNSNSYSVYTHNKDEALNYYRNNNVHIEDSYDFAKDNYLDSQKESIRNTLTISLVVLVISLIEIMLMIRSSFLSRIKEVGIYRAIGIKKSDIYKMFAGEILAITMTASLFGILVMSYILYCLSSVSYIGNMYIVNIFTILISIALVIIFNLIVGLLPVYNTIRKTPASILARYDVD